MSEETGTAYSILIYMLFLCIGLDLFSFIRVFILKSIDRKEYCTVGIRWGKVIAYGIFGIIMLTIGVLAEMSAYTKTIHYIIGGLLAADCAFCVIVKRKYGGNLKG